MKLKYGSQIKNSKPLEIEDRINLTMVIKWRQRIKMRYSIEPRDRIYVKV